MPQISLIIPTINEAENLPPLLARIAQALRGRDWEAIIVDDASTDGTPAVCQSLSKDFPIKLLTRIYPSNGLSGAVIHGMAEAKGDFLVVMDADLQHPPERVPALLEPLENNSADFAVGSRYVGGFRAATRDVSAGQASHAHRLQNRPGADLQMPGKVGARGAHPFRGTHPR